MSRPLLPVGVPAVQFRLEEGLGVVPAPAKNRKKWPNERPGADAGRRVLFAFIGPRPRAAQAGRSPMMRAERAKPKSHRDDTIIAQGKRSPGFWTQNDSLFFPFRLGAPEVRPAGREKEVGWGALYPGRRPQRPCAGLLSCCPSGALEGRIGSAGGLPSRLPRHPACGSALSGSG